MAKKPDMEYWYGNYESQCWYKNTFLVSDFRQIAQVVRDNRNMEWNNIEDSGCHFVCLSMIIGINPAYLSSMLKDLGFFKFDRTLNARQLNSRSSVYLVWDRNRPNKDKGHDKITIENIYHHKYYRKFGMIDIEIQCKEIKSTNYIKTAKNLIKEHRSMGHHIICGFKDHSYLIAGENNDKYFLWDPDLSGTTEIDKNMNGEYDLHCFYSDYEEYINNNKKDNEKAEYWIYSVKITGSIR